MSDRKLLPCPFCGSDSLRIQLFHQCYQVCCNECASRSGAYLRQNDAVYAWNRRDGVNTTPLDNTTKLDSQ